MYSRFRDYYKALLQFASHDSFNIWIINNFVSTEKVRNETNVIPVQTMSANIHRLVGLVSMLSLEGATIKAQHIFLIPGFVT